MARLISLEDIRRRYMLRRERLMERRVFEREQRGRGRRCLLPKTNWKALKISQSRPRPNLELHLLLLPSLTPPPPFPSGVAALLFRLARYFAMALLPTARFLLPHLFHNNTPAAISCITSGARL